MPYLPAMRAGWPIGLLLAIVVAANASATPQADCSSREVKSAVRSFVTAFNQGDHERLDALFADKPEFQWYSSPRPGPRLGREARRRDTLIDYFRARHAAKDRLSLVSFGFNGNGGRYADFEMTVRRLSPGFRHGSWFLAIGKGAATCGGGSVEFVVMSHGRPLPQPAGARATGRARS